MSGTTTPAAVVAVLVLSLSPFLPSPLLQALAATTTVIQGEQGEWKTAKVWASPSPAGNYIATVKYKLSNGELGFPYIDINGKAQVERNVIVADPYFQQLSLNIINSTSAGTIILELPRSVIDSKTTTAADNATRTAADALFTAFFRYPTGVIVPASVVELNKTADTRLVSIDFPVLPSDNAYNLGIKGTYVIPEFGGWATAALALSFASVLFLFTKSRMFSSKY
jgi:hypothetical protein